MSEPTIGCCGTCCFFLIADDKVGNCHKKAPTCVYIPGSSDQHGRLTQPSVRSMWPPVGVNEWGCGDYIFKANNPTVAIDERLAGDPEGTS